MADHLYSYCTAHMNLCFHICKKTQFSCDAVLTVTMHFTPFEFRDKTVIMNNDHVSDRDQIVKSQ